MADAERIFISRNRGVRISSKDFNTRAIFLFFPVLMSVLEMSSGMSSKCQFFQFLRQLGYLMTLKLFYFLCSVLMHRTFGREKKLGTWGYTPWVHFHIQNVFISQGLKIFKILIHSFFYANCMDMHLSRHAFKTTNQDNLFL